MHRKVAAAIVAVLALGIASCGSSEGPELTKAQLVTRIEIACRSGRQATEEYARAHREDAGSALHFVSSILAGQQAVKDKVDELNAPAAEDADFDRFKQGMQDRIELLERVQSAGKADVERAMRSAQAEGEAITQRFQVAARRLGVRIQDAGCA